jgi:PLP dependent protein
VSIAENYAAVKQRMEAAALRAHRHVEEVSLMAVTKTFPPESIRQAYGAGLRLFGESKIQEFAAKAKELGNLSDAKFHMIGHLQTNKATKAVDLFDAIDSVDSLRLAEKLNSAAAHAEKKLRVLIEINIGGEQAKSGVAPDSEELENILQAAPHLEHLEICGLMIVPPFTEDAEGSRPYFRKLRELRDRIAKRNLPAVTMGELSMGMSHDFEVAIEEGSTCVRVGTAMFGSREYRKH